MLWFLRKSRLQLGDLSSSWDIWWMELYAAMNLLNIDDKVWKQRMWHFHWVRSSVILQIFTDSWAQWQHVTSSSVVWRHWTGFQVEHGTVCYALFAVFAFTNWINNKINVKYRDLPQWTTCYFSPHFIYYAHLRVHTRNANKRNKNKLNFYIFCIRMSVSTSFAYKPTTKHLCIRDNVAFLIVTAISYALLTVLHFSIYTKSVS